jgi:hypothetical protein
MECGEPNPMNRGHPQRTEWRITAFLLAAAISSCGPVRYDTAKVAGELVALKQPYRSVNAEYYTDGGSCGVRIVDGTGVDQFFFSSASLNEPAPYSRLWVGGIPGEDATSREIAHPEHTKAMLAEILRNKSSRTREEDLCLAALSSRRSYGVRAGIRGLFGE